MGYIGKNSDLLCRFRFEGPNLENQPAQPYLNTRIFYSYLVNPKTPEKDRAYQTQPMLSTTKINSINKHQRYLFMEHIHILIREALKNSKINYIYQKKGGQNFMKTGFFFAIVTLGGDWVSSNLINVINFTVFF